MFTPKKFSLGDEQVDAALRGAGLATLVSPGTAGLLVTPLPLLYDAERGVLAGHVARPNPHWSSLVPGGESVALFHGVDGYVSPSNYATKAETGKVVPTWNYEVIAVYGTLRVHDDVDWVREHVVRLSDSHEAGRDIPWSVSDAPRSYVEGQLRGIVGVELEISRWSGKAKMSQNQPDVNKDSVQNRLALSGDPAERRLGERVAHHDPRTTG